MEKSVSIQHILSQISKLDYEARLYLVERQIKQLRKANKDVQKNTHNLTELNALGAEVWKNVNIEKYVEQERQWD